MKVYLSLRDPFKRAKRLQRLSGVSCGGSSDTLTCVACSYLRRFRSWDRTHSNKGTGFRSVLQRNGQ